MAIMAYSLPLTQIAIASGVIFLLLFTQVNISVITIRKMYGDKLDYGFKTPFLSRYSNYRGFSKTRPCNLSANYTAYELGNQSIVDWCRLFLV